MELFILYGSQTGTAEDIARYIWRSSKNLSFVGPVMTLDDFPFSKLVNTRLAIFVVSTTGQGEEPDNMKNFWKLLLRKSLPADSLKHLKFACLGLGDSSYTYYNFVAKKLYKRLIQLSASPIIPLGLCDDQHDLGIGAVYLPWNKDLWISFQNLFPNISKVQSDLYCFKWQIQEFSENTIEKEKIEWSKGDEVFQLVLKENIRITEQNHFQDVRLLNFFIPKNYLWSPGTLINVFPCNSDRDVDDFFKLLLKANLIYNRHTAVTIKNVEKDMPLPVPYRRVITLGIAAKYVWDLKALPRQSMLEVLAFNCNDEREKTKLIELSSFECLEEFNTYITKSRRTILELLYDFPNATAGLSLQTIFELFPIIRPRSYSIASVPETGTLDILVAVVEYNTILSSPRLGLCSNWLKNLQVYDEIFATVKASKMKFPNDIYVPIIMVSTGTGLAPFRSLILRREAFLKKNIHGGEIILFFGCRNKTKDFHCQWDIIRFEQIKLIKCFTAFSRDYDHKIYVQDVILENRELIRKMLLNSNCRIFVVGSSRNMPKAVKEVFIKVMGEKHDIIEEMIQTSRYQEETWD